MIKKGSTILITEFRVLVHYNNVPMAFFIKLVHAYVDDMYARNAKNRAGRSRPFANFTMSCRWNHSTDSHCMTTYGVVLVG